MDLVVLPTCLALWNERQLRCAIGKNGVINADDKREGDLKTPIGRWPMRYVLYREDRLPFIQTRLPIRGLSIDNAWCEEPEDIDYNKLVSWKLKPKADHMWRDDHLYDVVVVLGHNDNPVKPYYGSAIFLHLARPDFTPTAGCVSVALPDLLTILAEADDQSSVDIRRS